MNKKLAKELLLIAKSLAANDENSFTVSYNPMEKTFDGELATVSVRGSKGSLVSLREFQTPKMKSADAVRLYGKLNKLVKDELNKIQK